MTAYETYCLYEAVKLHFTTDSFDFVKYNGKVRTNVSSFEKRKDKYHFYRLSRKMNNKEEMTKFIVYNFVDRNQVWVGNLLEEEAEICYRTHLGVSEALSYYFTEDCRKMMDKVLNPNELLETNGNYPLLLKMLLQKDVQIETVCLLNSILKFLPMWTKKIEDTIQWPNYQRKITKFTAFLPQDIVRYTMLLKKVIAEK